MTTAKKLEKKKVSSMRQALSAESSGEEGNEAKKAFEAHQAQIAQFMNAHICKGGDST